MNQSTASTRTCFACGDQRHQSSMAPFGRTCFGEVQTWVCDDCHTVATLTAHAPQPTLAATATR